MNNLSTIEKSIENRRKINLDKAVEALDVAEKRDLSLIASAHVVEKRNGYFDLLFVAKVKCHRKILYLTSVNVDGHRIRTCSKDYFRKSLLKTVVSRNYSKPKSLKQS